jgi:hypothetical protein
MDKYTVVQLRELAKKQGYSGYSRMSKDDLLLLIKGKKQDKCIGKYCPPSTICNSLSGKCLAIQKNPELKKELKHQKKTRIPDTQKVVPEFRMARPPISKTTKYLGNAWDEFIGMIYLMYKYPENSIAIPDVLLNKKRELRFDPYAHGFDPYDLQTFHTSLGWSEKNQNFEVPLGLFTSIKKCLKTRSTFIIIPFGFSCIDESSSHSNLLVYNTKTKELERFEPYGSAVDNCYNVDGFDLKLKNLFNNNVRKNMINDVYEPLSFCPTKSFQYIEEEQQKGSLEPDGFCVAWSFWYADTRMANPDKSRSEVVNIALQTLKNDYRRFRTFIRSYSNFLEKLSSKIVDIKKAYEIFEDEQPEYY